MKVVKIAKIKGMNPFTGEKYGLLFVKGSAITDSDYLAHRLSQKKGFTSAKITKAEAAKIGLVFPKTDAEIAAEEEETETE